MLDELVTLTFCSCLPICSKSLLHALFALNIAGRPEIKKEESTPAPFYSETFTPEATSSGRSTGLTLGGTTCGPALGHKLGVIDGKSPALYFSMLNSTDNGHHNLSSPKIEGSSALPIAWSSPSM